MGIECNSFNKNIQAVKTKVPTGTYSFVAVKYLTILNLDLII